MNFFKSFTQPFQARIVFHMIDRYLLRYPTGFCLWILVTILFFMHVSYAKMVPNFQVISYSNHSPVASSSKNLPNPPSRVAAGSCEPTSFAAQLPNGFEPSDLAFDSALSRLYCVSDGGEMIAVYANGSLAQRWSIPGAPDLEGVSVIPNRPGKVYLAREYPPAVLEFDLTSQQLIVVAELPEIESLPDTTTPSYLNKRKTKQDGIESIVYASLPLKQGPVDLFIIGRQTDAALFYYKIQTKNGNLSLQYLGYQPGIGTQQDLSSLTFWKNRLWALFDKNLEMLAFAPSSLTSLSTNPDDIDTVSPPQEDQQIGTFEFEIRGQEGISFVKGTDGQDYVFIAVDAPHKTGRKDLLRYTLQDFFTCFAPYGMKSMPAN